MSNHEWQDDRDKGLEYLREAIDFFDGRCNSVASWGSLANCLMSYAFQIDEEDPERMKVSLEKAAHELYLIYKATGKKREADRLTARMRRSGIELCDE